MKKIIVVLILMISTVSWGQGKDPVVSSEAIKISTEIPLVDDLGRKSNKKLKVEIDANIGEEYDRSWLERKVREAHQQGANVEFIVMGEASKAKNIDEALETLEYVKNSKERTSFLEAPLPAISDEQYERKKRGLVVVSAVLAGGSTLTTVFFGMGADLLHSAYVGILATTISAVWTNFNKPYFKWIGHHKWQPKVSEKLKEFYNHSVTYGKQLAVGTVAGFLIQVAAQHAIGNHGFHWGYLFAETAWVTAQSLAMKHFWRGAQLKYTAQKVLEDVRNANPMDLFNIKTSIGISVAFNSLAQLMLFGVPFVEYGMYGLGAAGFVVYKYVTDPRIRETLDKFTLRKSERRRAKFAGAYCQSLFAL